MATQLLYSEIFKNHNYSSHPENAKRLDVMIDAINKSKIKKDLEFIEPKILPEQYLPKIHSEEMIEIVKDMSNDTISWIDPDTYVSKNDYETARLAAGGLLELCNNVIKNKTDNGYALVRPPGHHATPVRSMGFCLFNNAAIAANEIAKKGKKVLIFDPDVHHGNGTQDVFYSRKDVLYQSLHLSPHFPGTGPIGEIGIGEGEGYNMNMPLAYGCGVGSANKVIQEIFIPVAKQFEPDIIIYSTGYDSHHMDMLGGLKYTANFYAEMLEKYLEIQSKLVITIEGGYNLNWIGKCLLSELAVLVGKNIEIKDSAQETQRTDEKIILLKKLLKEKWDF